MDPQRAFKEIANYVRTNMKGGVTHYIQRALNTGEHYLFGNEAPANPTVSTTTNTQEVEEETVVTASSISMLTFQVQEKSHIIKMDKYDMGCNKLYLWTWTMCTTENRDKIRGLKEFPTLDWAVKFHDLIKAIKSVTLQFE